MLTERQLQISPIVQESVMHNTKVRPVPTATPGHSPSAHSQLTTRALSGSVQLWTPSFYIISSATLIINGL